jgi:tetratricopeptide (TPR) repeat protein
VLSGLAEKHQLELDAPRTDALFARARAASPADITVLESGARVREARGDVAGARALLDDALRARPRDAEIELALARLLSRRGEARAAAELCERVLERTRPDVDVLNLIAFTLADAALRPDDARRFAWRAIALDPLNGSVIDTLGWAELRAGDAASAVETLARADRLDPDEPEILLHLAEAQRAMGRVDDARKSASRAQALASTDDPLRARIDALVATLGAS